MPEHLSHAKIVVKLAISSTAAQSKSRQVSSIRFHLLMAVIVVVMTRIMIPCMNGNANMSIPYV